jgi:hypothetical protein
MPADIQHPLRPATASLMRAVIGRHHQPGMNRPTQAESIRERASSWHPPQHQAAVCTGHPGWRVAQQARHVANAPQIPLIVKQLPGAIGSVSMRHDLAGVVVL